MSKNILIVLIISFLCVSAFAQESIEVEPDVDTKALDKIVMDMFPMAMACVAAETQELKKSGKTDQEIAEIFSDKTKEEELNKQCMCALKTQLEEKVNAYDAILSKHTDWQGKILVVKEGSATERIDTTGIEKIKKTLSECP